MKLSVVTTLYHSENYIREFYSRILLEIHKITDDYEIVFVDDGSPDNSLYEAIKIQGQDINVKVIELSRNFGHHKAIITGLENSVGDYVFLIDIDLEEEPELLSTFWKQYSKLNVDVVYGVQQERKGGRFEKISGASFYYLFNTFSNQVKLEKNLSTVRLMNREYIDSLVQYKEKDYYLAPIFVLAGFKQKSIEIDKYSKSKTTYNFLKKYHILIESIISFSTKPLYIIFYSGLLITIFSFLMILFILIKKFYYGVGITGWSSLMVSLYFLGGVFIMFLGIVSLYISKIFLEVKNRPFSLIKKIYTKDGNK